jgi:Lipocalin-like domain
MDNRVTMRFATIALMCLGVAGPASAQSLKDKAVGAYTLESGTENYADGKKLSSWATGNLILDASGHMSMFLIGKDRAKTSDSVRAPVGPAVGFYGSYTIDEAAGVINLKIESGVTPMFDGTVRSWKIAVNGDVLTATAPETKTPEGMMTPINAWKKLK